MSQTVLADNLIRLRDVHYVTAATTGVVLGIVRQYPLLCAQHLLVCNAALYLRNVDVRAIVKADADYPRSYVSLDLERVTTTYP